MAWSPRKLFGGADEEVANDDASDQSPTSSLETPPPAASPLPPPATSLSDNNADSGATAATTHTTLTVAQVELGVEITVEVHELFAYYDVDATGTLGVDGVMMALLEVTSCTLLGMDHGT